MCRIVLWILTLLYIGALALLIVGTFGLFGQDKDPLSGIFLIPMGMPWTMLADYIPAAVRPWFAAGTPIINLLIVRWLCFRFGK